MPKNGFIGHFHVSAVKCVDGNSTYEETTEEAVKLKFDFIVMTDHRMCDENVKKCLNETRILCIPGQIVSTPKGYVHVVDAKMAIPPELYYLGEIPNISTKDTDYFVNLTFEEIVKRAHEQGAIAMIDDNVVWRNGTDELKNVKFDAIQSNDEKTCKNISKNFGLPCTFSSHAHNETDLKYMYSLCKADSLTREAIKDAIKEGKCEIYMPLSLKIRNFFLSYVI